MQVKRQFIQIPPPCRSKIIYLSVGDGVLSALFYCSLEGLRGTAKWAALRENAIDEPSELPSVLVNFDYICEGLIEAGHGQVCCLACDKIYSAGEIVKHTCFIGSWLMAYYRCPTQHDLMSREVGHFMFKRNDE